MHRNTPPENQEATVRTLAMPRDTNGLGDIFGGWIMSHADIAGAILAFRRAGGRVVTVAVNDFQFLQPVFVGDVVSFYTDIHSVGNTSIKVDITVFSGRQAENAEERQELVAKACISYVHIGRDRKPKPIPGLKTEKIGA